MRIRLSSLATLFAWVLAGCHASADKPQPVSVVRSTPPEREQPTADHQRQIVPPPQDDVSLEAGREVFRKNCAACHDEEGRGSIGPNLTDRCFVHGHRREDIRRVVVDGVPDKGMVAWRSLLSEDDVHAVTSYVESITGQELPGKACEGKRVEPTP